MFMSVLKFKPRKKKKKRAKMLKTWKNVCTFQVSYIRTVLLRNYKTGNLITTIALHVIYV